MGVIKDFIEVKGKGIRARRDVYDILSIQDTPYFGKLIGTDKGRKLVHDFYKKLKKRYPELGIYTNRQIRDYIKKFHERILDEVVSTKEGVSLPDSMGDVLVVSYGAKNKVVNYNRSVNVGKEVHFSNDHSMGYNCKGIWSNELMKYKWPNSDCWTFETSKLFKKKMSIAYRKFWKTFLIVPSLRTVHNFLREYRKKEKSLIESKKDYKTEEVNEDW